MLKQWFFLNLFFVLMFFSTTSCTKNQSPQPPNPNDTVSFANDVVPIFNASCSSAGCHNGSISPDLRAQNAYNALIGGGYINLASPPESELYQWMLGNRGIAMPPEGSNSAYNQTVLTWIEQGALEN